MSSHPHLAALTALLVASLAGCNREPPGETLLIAGSGTMHGFLQPVADAFGKKHGNASVVNEEGGSTAAVIALKRGAIDIATVGRDLTPDEDDLAVRNYMIARDGLAIVVNRANPVSNITAAKLALVYEGEITSWKALGGDEAPVTVLVRAKYDETRKRNSTSRRSFDELVLGSDEPTRDAKVQHNAREMIEAIKHDAGAIGYLTLRDLSPDVKALTVDGVPISKVSILSLRYPLSRSYYLAVMRPSRIAEAFITFTLSKEGQNLLHEDGLVPVRLPAGAP